MKSLKNPKSCQELCDSHLVLAQLLGDDRASCNVAGGWGGAATMAGWLQQQHSRSFPLKQLPSQAAHRSTVMGAHQSLAATATGAGPDASQNQPPTTATAVEMSDGRVVSFEEYLLQCSDRFLPVRAPRASRVGDVLPCAVICVPALTPAPAGLRCP